jgi:hypothetical protein
MRLRRGCSHSFRGRGRGHHQILAGILWLGNVTFTGGAPANIVDQQPMETAAFLLQLPPEILGNSLTHKAVPLPPTLSSLHSTVFLY